MIQKLSEAERAESLALLPHWTTVEGRDAIRRSLAFTNFTAAFAFMTRVALVAEKVDHHPEWSNVYNRVDILLSAHAAGGLSSRDLALAQAIDRLYAAGPA